MSPPSAVRRPQGRNSECRKPKPGLILAAARDLNLDLKGSILIGDQKSDIAAARAAGISEERALLIGPATRTDRSLCQECVATDDPAGWSRP